MNAAFDRSDDRMGARANRRGKLVLADGTCYQGRIVGSGRLPVWGEVVFNTSMTGYQEILTDPSYAGQIIVMTYPQIGNYGVHADDCERGSCAARALVVRELSPFFSPGPGRQSLEGFMTDNGMPGLSEVDTRSIALRIRSQGAVVGVIGTVDQSDESLVELARSKRFSAGQQLVESVSGDLRNYSAGDLSGGRVAVVDFGVKESIVSSVRALGVDTVVIGARHHGDGGFDTDEVLDGGFDLVVLSNGPGDPADAPGAIRSTQRLLGRIPILGICLGHQITALALGASTFKLKFGHRGANQPVYCRDGGRVFVTSQNHGYAVSDDISKLIPDTEITYTNLNDGTVEGFRCGERMIECVQFHPEASPGPHDSFSIFADFYERARKWSLRSMAAPEKHGQNERMANVQTV